MRWTLTGLLIGSRLFAAIIVGVPPPLGVAVIAQAFLLMDPAARFMPLGQSRAFKIKVRLGGPTTAGSAGNTSILAPPIPCKSKQAPTIKPEAALIASAATPKRARISVPHVEVNKAAGTQSPI